METNIVTAPENQKSKITTAWESLGKWLSKVFIFIAPILAFFATGYIFRRLPAPEQQDMESYIALAVICWVILSVIAYALLYLFKSVILVCLLFSPLVLCVGLYIYANKKPTVTTGTGSIAIGIFPFSHIAESHKLDSILNRIGKLDSSVHSLTITVDSLNRTYKQTSKVITVIP